jgi:hypothetical protein
LNSTVRQALEKWLYLPLVAVHLSWNSKDRKSLSVLMAFLEQLKHFFSSLSPPFLLLLWLGGGGRRRQTVYWQKAQRHHQRIIALSHTAAEDLEQRCKK